MSKNWDSWVKYYDEIQDWAETQLNGADSFNQTGLLSDEDPVVRIIGLTCLRDYVREKQDRSALDLFVPVFEDKDERVRLMAYQEALGGSLRYFPEDPISYEIVNRALEDRWSKEIGSTILRNLREILNHNYPKEMWARYLPIAKRYITDWHEPTRVEAAFYIGHCISLGLLKDPYKAIDLILQDRSGDVRWAVSWLIGGLKGQLMEDRADVEKIFRRYKDYPADKFPEVHICLIGSFARWKDVLKENKEVQEYLARLFGMDLGDGGLGFTRWIADRTFAYNHPVMIRCYMEALESERPEARAWGRYWLNRIVKEWEDKKDTPISKPV